MNLNLYTLCVIYLVYSFLGWVGETVVATAKGRRFTNRGVASGPFCFVYGTAGVLITIGLNDQRTSLAALFFGSMIYATVVEWLTAKLLERIHHRRWWDYSDKKFNLDGYVCLQYSLLWGLLGMAAVRWGNDLLFRLCAHLPPLLFHAVVWGGMALAVLDQISAMVVVSRYANRHPRLEQLNLDIANMELLGDGITPMHTTFETNKEKIRNACGCPEAEVYLLGGGTQTNAVVIASMLNRYEGVIAAETGHVNGHEAGAIEYTGHKVLALPQVNGKLQAETVKAYVERFYGDANHEHMVFPGMVYISHPTEYGTLYTKKELEELSAVCRQYEMPLFLDGARLGYGLVSKETDVTLEDIARLTDVFYIGGTKVGALCGEAVVFPKKAPKYFMTLVKQQGALLAKGRLAGVQFDTLFTDDLYCKISKNAIETADRLKQALKEKGYQFFIDSPTNQIFIVLEDCQMEELGKKVEFGFWEKYDENHTVVRFATSWGTKMEDIEELIRLL